MPIEFTQEDISEFSTGKSEMLVAKVFNYLMEPLGVNSEDVKKEFESKKITEFLSSTQDNTSKLSETLWAFFYGTRPHLANMKNDDNSHEIIGSFYKENRELALDVIDRLHELVSIETGNNKIDKTVKFYTKPIIDHFTESKTLLDQISTEHLVPIVERSRGKITKTQTFKKDNGDHLGTVIDFNFTPHEEEKKNIEDKDEQKNEEKTIRFYVKTQQNFQIKSTSGQQVDISGAGENIDYRELMIYKILEQTKFGPKCSFCVHPFARGAVLIATQAADFTKTYAPEHKKFKEGSKFKDYSEFQFSKKDSLDLNGIDLMARILNITDLNENNYGRVTLNKISDTVAREDEKNKWKIIDFRILEGRDNSSSIYEDFVNTKNNDSFVRSAGGFVDKIIRFSEREKKQQVAEELVKILGSQQGNRCSFEDFVEHSFTEICQFLDDEKNKHYLRLNDKVVEGIKDGLAEYKKTIIGNYEAFKTRTEEASNSHLGSSK